MNNIMTATHHVMVASPHYLATMVGIEILQAGGNAFDAAVAVSAALGVVYPHMTGLGGDSFFLLYDAAKCRVRGFNGSGRSASAATRSFFQERGMLDIPLRGPLSAITVPGMVDSWWQVSRTYGRLQWDRLLEPAIRLAEGGFPVSRNLAYWLNKDESLLRADEGMDKVFSPGGKLLTEGERLVQTDLAQALKQIAVEGRDAFYNGELMKRIVEGVRNTGGLLQEEDFRMHAGEWVDPITTNYRGYDLYQMPPNSQGFSALIMMNMLESFDLTRIPRVSADYYHLMVEIIKRSFRERDRYLSDPDFVQIPLELLLSKPYANQLCADLDVQANSSFFVESQAIGQDTAYAAIVDDEGNAVSFIQSLYFDFGSAFIPKDTGVVLQNRGSFFSLSPTHPNTLESRKRSFHTLMPAMVCKDGTPFMLYGTQGGEGQSQTQLSIITSVLDYGSTIQEAICHPRWVYGRTWGGDSDSLKIEGRVGSGVIHELGRRGHVVEKLNDWDGTVGQAQGILIDRERGLLTGAADPRGDGLAMGW